MTHVVGWLATWTGEWHADDGKTVRVEREGESIAVSVFPRPSEPPYRSAELLGGGTRPIERLQARCCVDEKGRRYLEIEAGTPEV